jgi:hypothetical protein
LDGDSASLDLCYQFCGKANPLSTYDTASYHLQVDRCQDVERLSEKLDHSRNTFQKGAAWTRL